MVIGPTPPGTGVIARARSAAAANSTSPFRLPSGRRFLPRAAAGREAPGGRAGREAGAAEGGRGHVAGAEAAPFLPGRDRGDAPAGVVVLGRGELPRVAVPPPIRVQPRDQRQQIVL